MGLNRSKLLAAMRMAVMSLSRIGRSGICAGLTLAFISAGSVQAQTTVPKPTGNKPAETGTAMPAAKTSPSWTETFEFLRTKVEGCTTRMSGTSSSGVVVYQTEVTKFLSPEAFVIQLETKRYPISDTGRNSRENTYFYERSVHRVVLKNLSALVKMDNESYKPGVLYAGCAVSGCVKKTLIGFGPAPLMEYDWDNPNPRLGGDSTENIFWFPVCSDHESASKALLHAIGLAGGKKPLF